MKRLLFAFLGSLAALVTLLLFVVVVAAVVAAPSVEVEDDSYLVINLVGKMPEYDPPGSVMSQIAGEDVETLQRVLTNLDKARVDDRIKGVLLRVDMMADPGFAAAQEIHQAIARVQAAGKKVYGWAENLMTQNYFLLSACDEVLIPPYAFVSFIGLHREVMHLKQLLKKIGVKAHLHKIKDYKAAAEMFTREQMSEEARQNRQWVLDELWAGLTETLQAKRNLSPEQVSALMQRGVMTAQEAYDGKLVDDLIYWDQLESRLKGDHEDDEDQDELAVVTSIDYAEIDPGDLDLDGDQTIAVIHAQGMIFGRKNDVSPMFGTLMGHETIVSELRRARRDESVAAVVFRVDSRGGDGSASDMIAREIEATDAVKPVVASMANIAASGGYWVSYRARKVVANPLTITGSIGSISGKFNIKGLYDHLGITHDHVTKGPNALFHSNQRDFTDQERVRFEENHWAGFNQWLSDIAARRGMSFAEAEKLAHGRVWTGRQARDHGLVDEIGDQWRAIELAKELAEIPADESVTIAHYPESKGLLAQVLGEGATTAARWMLHRALQREIATTVGIMAQHPELAVETLVGH